MADNLKQLITDVVTGLDQSVTELYPLVDSQVVDSAVGVWLDLLGGLVGCKPRTTSTGFQNYTDTQYRKIVKAKIAINILSGFSGSPFKPPCLYCTLCFSPKTTGEKKLQHNHSRE